VDALSMITEKEEEKINKAIDKHLGEGAGKAVNKLLKGFSILKIAPAVDRPIPGKAIKPSKESGK
jgi:hypothetical protein